MVTRIGPSSGRAALDINELWNYRELLWLFAWKDIAVRYKQTVLGVAWVISVGIAKAPPIGHMTDCATAPAKPTGPPGAGRHGGRPEGTAPTVGLQGAYDFVRAGHLLACRRVPPLLDTFF
jgi:hypothetical protein